MFVKLSPTATDDQIDAVCEKITSAPGVALQARVDQGAKHNIVSVIGTVNGGCEMLMAQLQAMDGVDGVTRIGKPYQIAARKAPEQKTVVDVGHGTTIGGHTLALVAGPCSIESYEQLSTIAHHVKASGAQILRGGAFKPRTAPRAFEGLGVEGLKMLDAVGKEQDMSTQTEVMEPDKVELVASWADILQIGARNMQNFNLLKAVGDTKHPVVLKRGPAASVDEWLCAAEHILDRGNNNVILCARGIVGIDKQHTRNTSDVVDMRVAQKLSHLPMMWDPSHAVGKPDLIPDAALAGVGQGIDALHIEVHHDPTNAKTDGQQALRPHEYDLLVRRAQVIHDARKQAMQLVANES